MALSPEDIVTDLDNESVFFGKQGRIIKIQLRFWGEPEVIVWFDRKDCPDNFFLGDEDNHEEGVYVEHQLHFLEKNEDWEPDIYARRFFGTHWHTTCKNIHPLTPEKLCQVSKCSSYQSKTIWFNIWGSVCNAHVCTEHARAYHRMCGDSFPWREPK